MLRNSFYRLLSKQSNQKRETPLYNLQMQIFRSVQLNNNTDCLTVYTPDSIAEVGSASGYGNDPQHDGLSNA